MLDIDATKNLQTDDKRVLSDSEDSIEPAREPGSINRPIAFLSSLFGPTSPINPLNPASPLNPANPANPYNAQNPASPLNPANWQRDGGYRPERPDGAGAPPGIEPSDFSPGSPGFNGEGLNVDRGSPPRIIDPRSAKDFRVEGLPWALPVRAALALGNLLMKQLDSGPDSNDPPPRGVKWTLESSNKSPRAEDWEDGLEGVTYDIATHRRNVPALQYSNPNPRGRDEIRYDGVDPDNSMILIDRKINATTKSKQIGDMQRWAKALEQNPGYSVRVEVPDIVAQKNVIRLLQKAQVTDSPITVEIKK